MWQPQLIASVSEWWQANQDPHTSLPLLEHRCLEFANAYCAGWIDPLIHIPLLCSELLSVPHANRVGVFYENGRKQDKGCQYSNLYLDMSMPCLGLYFEHHFSAFFGSYMTAITRPIFKGTELITIILAGGDAWIRCSRENHHPVQAAVGHAFTAIGRLWQASVTAIFYGCGCLQDSMWEKLNTRMSNLGVA